MVESALVQFPDEAALHDLLGQLHQRSGRPDGMKDARVSFSRAIALKPNVWSYQERYGVAFSRSNAFASSTASLFSTSKVSTNISHSSINIAWCTDRHGGEKLRTVV